jgi:uncharacterized protein (DUF1330 family)
MPSSIVGNCEIRDPERFNTYVPGAMEAIAAHGGETLAADTSAQTIEGEEPPAAVAIRFPDKDARTAGSRRRTRR